MLQTIANYHHPQSHFIVRNEYRKAKTLPMLMRKVVFVEE